MCEKAVIKGVNGFTIECPELLSVWGFDKNSFHQSQFQAGRGERYSGSVLKAICVMPLSIDGIRKTGCPFCAYHAHVPGINDLATSAPKAAVEWNYEHNRLKPSQVSGVPCKKYWWKCSKFGHEWEAVVASKTKKGQRCLKCVKKRTT